MELVGCSGATFAVSGGRFVKTANGSAARRLTAQAEWYAAYAEQFDDLFPRYLGCCVREGQVELHLERLDRFLPLPAIAAEAGSAVACQLYERALARVVEEMHVVSTQEQPEGHWVHVLLAQTLERLRSVSVDPRTPEPVAELVTSPSVEVGGRRCRGLLSAVESIRHRISIRPLADEATVLCHGDIHASNILSDGQAVRLVDPRGDFPGGTRGFSRQYDFGKVVHDFWCDYTNIVTGHLHAIRGEGHDAKYSWRVHARYIDWSPARATVRNRYLSSDAAWVAATLAGSLQMAGILPFHAERPWATSIGCSAAAALDDWLGAGLGNNSVATG